MTATDQLDFLKDRERRIERNRPRPHVADGNQPASGGQATHAGCKGGGARDFDNGVRSLAASQLSHLRMESIAGANHDMRRAGLMQHFALTFRRGDCMRPNAWPS